MGSISRILAASLIAGLLVGALPASGAQSSGSPSELAYTDPKGDPFFGTGNPVPGAPATPITDAVDLVSFRLYGEDQEGFYIEMGVNQLKPVAPPTFEFNNWMNTETSFKLDGTNFRYNLRLQITTAMARVPAGVVPLPASFCISDAGRGNCVGQRVFATVDWDKSLLTAYITKSAVMGQDPTGDPGRSPPNPPRLEIGSRIAEIRTVSGGGTPLVVSDSMPNIGTQGPYQMLSNAANDRIRVKLNQVASATVDPRSQNGGFTMTAIHDLPSAAVSPGSSALVQIALENWNAGKRLVNLTTELVDQKDKNNWEARIVPTITVPGEDRRIVNLIVNLTGSVEHRSSTVVRITARSLGFPDEIGVMKLRLIAAIPPSPTAKVLYFHVAGVPSAATTICTWDCAGQSWINTLEKDPKGTSDAGASLPNQRSQNLNTAEFYRTFILDAPLNNDLVLDTREPVKATLIFRSDVPQSGTGKLELFGGEIFIGTGEAAWGGNGPTHITFQPLLEAARIPAGTLLTARVSLTVGPALNPFVFGDKTKPQIVAQGSSIELPIIKDPKPPTKNAIPAGPAFLTLESDGDTEQFVNPGKVRVFRLTLVNEGVQEDVVKITNLKDPENWYAALNPSDSFRLKPGESARFGVLVKAPSGAKEGEQAHILVNATSSVDPNSISQATLTAIVTTGIELEDEADNFTADEDTVAHVEEAPQKKSPGIGAAALVAATAGLVVLRRRRA